MGVEAATSESAEPCPGDGGATAQSRARRVAFGAFQDWEPSIRANLDPRYAADFIALERADLEAFDAVAPLRREHYGPLAARPDLFGRKFFHPTIEVAALCHDKLELTRFLIAHGFADFTPALREPGPPYPYVWKRRCSGWGRDCHVVSGPDDEGLVDLADQDWFAQALAPGPVEFAAHVLRAGGELHYVSTVGYLMPSPMSVRGQNQAPVRAEFRRGSHYPALLGDILSALDYQGTACFNYKVVDGKPLIFEINPRYGASLSVDITAYLDAYFGALSGGQTPRG